MTRQYKAYGPKHFEDIKPRVIQWMVDGVTIKSMSVILDMKFKTLANMLHRNGLFANTVRHQHRKAQCE